MTEQTGTTERESSDYMRNYMRSYASTYDKARGLKVIRFRASEEENDAFQAAAKIRGHKSLRSYILEVLSKDARDALGADEYDRITHGTVTGDMTQDLVGQIFSSEEQLLSYIRRYLRKTLVDASIASTGDFLFVAYRKGTSPDLTLQIQRDEDSFTVVKVLDPMLTHMDRQDEDSAALASVEDQSSGIPASGEISEENNLRSDHSDHVPSEVFGESGILDVTLDLDGSDGPDSFVELADLF